MPTDADTVHAFWFGNLSGGLAEDAVRRRWFAGGAEFDDAIRQRFGHLLAQAAAGALEGWRQTPRGTIALVVLCDQFPRQVHRGSPLAYGSDALALTIARQTVAEGRDEAFGPDERAFLYMPFEHSESRIDQHTSVGLFTVLRDAAPEDLGEITNAYLGHARHHRDIVQRFGRFPHRNAILGRRSTPEELKFLETAGDFGQTPAGAEPTSGPASGPGS